MSYSLDETAETQIHFILFFMSHAHPSVCSILKRTFEVKLQVNLDLTAKKFFHKNNRNTYQRKENAATLYYFLMRGDHSCTPNTGVPWFTNWICFTIWGKTAGLCLAPVLVLVNPSGILLNVPPFWSIRVPRHHRGWICQCGNPRAILKHA